MLRLIIIALLVWGGYYVVSSLNSRYQAVQRKEAASQATVTGAALEGMPPQMQGALDAAAAQGPAALKRWLDTNRRYCRDPRLGDIELDLAVALTRQDLGAAREIYKNVKARTPATSPLQPRLKKLGKTLE